MTSHVLPAALFATGLALGFGSASLIRPKEKSLSVPSSSSTSISTAPGRPSTLGEPRNAVVDAGPGFDVGPGGRQHLPVPAYPGPVADLLQNQAYIASYDRRLRHPSWTAEHLNLTSLQRDQPPSSPGGGGGGKKPDRSFSVFKEDERIPDLFRARLADYFRSGYDRGHMVPAADAKISQAAMDETFFLTNIAPQVGEGFNRDYWAHTEDFCRRLTSAFADVYVFTVPLYLPRQGSDGKWRVTYEVINKGQGPGVPTHFAKVILGRGRPVIGGPGSSNSLLTTLGLSAARDNSFVASAAFVIPNAIVPNDAPLKSFEVPVTSVERAAGLNLLPEALKSSSKPLCDVVNCSLVIREFNDRAKQHGNTNNNNKVGPSRSTSASPAIPAPQPLFPERA